MPPATGSRTVGVVTAPDRRQSTRQGRTTVRPTNYYARSFPGRLAANGLEQTPEASNAATAFLPALTHFTQAVDAFPKELIKHFSMFKEVEAKFHDPEHELKFLFHEIARLPATTQGQQRAPTLNSTGGLSSANVSVNGSMIQDGAVRHQQLATELFPADFNSLPPEEQADLKKRQLFYRLRMVVASMIPTLDEKLVVLTSAKTTKDKGLARMNNSFLHLDGEISEEARYGSLNHWAYADKEEKKKGGPAHERQRREVASANNLAAAAQHVHDVDSIAAKSEARREAMLANKRNRQQHIDSDFDDRPIKKTQKRKAIAADPAGGDARGIGLGITSNGIAPQGKRKKTEKALAAAVTAAPPMERSQSSALQVAGTGGRNGTSPRATPSADTGGGGGGGGPGKRKPRAPPAPAQRKHALPAYSPPLASSPIAPSFTASKAIVAERPVSSRSRKNSAVNPVTSTTIELPVGRRPSSSHSILQLASSNAITELEQAAGIIRDNASIKGDSTPKEPLDLPAPLELATLKHEEAEPQEPESMEIDAPVPTPITTRAGRASKTATPIVGTFPDLPMMARSRSTRNANNGNGNGGGSNSHASSENNSTTTGTVSKRGHKKNAASVTAMTVPSPALKPTTKSNPPSSAASSVAPDPEFSAGEEDEDGDEPRYCYCNEVSYGNMVACDYSDCPREWFHLGCVNMEKAPNARTKWFCSDECKEANARAKPNKGGRPGSSNKQ